LVLAREEFPEPEASLLQAWPALAEPVLPQRRVPQAQGLQELLAPGSESEREQRPHQASPFPALRLLPESCPKALPS
jgi:hypothetical protein